MFRERVAREVGGRQWDAAPRHAAAGRSSLDIEAISLRQAKFPDEDDAPASRGKRICRLAMRYSVVAQGRANMPGTGSRIEKGADRPRKPTRKRAGGLQIPEWCYDLPGFAGSGGFANCCFTGRRATARCASASAETRFSAVIQVKKKVRRKPVNFPDGPDRAAEASCNASIRARERCEVASGKCIRPLRCRRRNIVKEAAWSLGIRERAPTVYRLFLCHNLRHARNRETSVARAGSGAEGEKARPTSRPVSAVTLAALHWHRPVWHEVELGEGHPSKEPAVQRQRAQQWAWPRSASCC